MPATPLALRSLDIPSVIVMLQDYIAIGDLCIPSSGERRTSLDASLLSTWDLLVSSGFDEDIATYAVLMHLARVTDIAIEDADRALKTRIAERTLAAMQEVLR